MHPMQLRSGPFRLLTPPNASRTVDEDLWNAILHCRHDLSFWHGNSSPAPPRNPPCTLDIPQTPAQTILFSPLLITHSFPTSLIQFSLPSFIPTFVQRRPQLGLMRVLALLCAAAALALPLAPGGQYRAPAQLVLHGKPIADRVGLLKFKHSPDSLSQVPPPPLPSPHVQPLPPPPPQPNRLPPEQRLPTKQRLPPEYAEPERPAPEPAQPENSTEPAEDTDVSLCITLAGLAALAGDAPEQGEVRLCMGADTSPARRVYTKVAGWAARSVFAHPMDVARAWAAIVQHSIVGSA